MLAVASILQTCLASGVVLIAVKEGRTLGNDPGSKFIAVAFGMAAEIERNFISQRTKEALARKKAEGIQLGRPAGTRRPEYRKLHGKDEEIIRLLKWLREDGRGVGPSRDVRAADPVALLGCHGGCRPPRACGGRRTRHQWCRGRSSRSVRSSVAAACTHQARSSTPPTVPG